MLADTIFLTMARASPATIRSVQCAMEFRDRRTIPPAGKFIWRLIADHDVFDGPGTAFKEKN